MFIFTYDALQMSLSFWITDTQSRFVCVQNKSRQSVLSFVDMEREQNAFKPTNFTEHTQARDQPAVMCLEITVFISTRHFNLCACV